MAKELIGYCPECGAPIFSGEGNTDYNYETGRLTCTCEECGWEGDESELDEFEEVVIDMWENGYDDDALKGYEIVVFPDSQRIPQLPDYYDHCWLINDEEGLKTYGSCAYVVEADWLHENE